METMTMESAQFSPSKSRESKKKSAPEVDQVIDAMVLALLMTEDGDFSDGNKRAKAIEEICAVGDEYADVRQWCIEYRETRDEAKRGELAGQIYAALDTQRAAMSALLVQGIIAPVTAMGA